MNGDMIRSRWQYTSTVVLAAAALVLVGTAIGGRSPTAPRDENGHPYGIAVSGHGTRTADPDRAYVSLSVVTRHKSSRKAAEDNARIAQAVTKAIRAVGIDAKDIQTRGYSMQPWIRYARNEEKMLGYEVQNTVRVTVRDRTKVSDVTDAGTAAGANQVQGISFGIEDDEKLRREALASAVANARRKAEAVARKLGVEVGEPLEVREGSTEQPAPYLATVPTGAPAARAAEPTPISPGRLEVSQEVEVTFRIVR